MPNQQDIWAVHPVKSSRMHLEKQNRKLSEKDTNPYIHDNIHKHLILQYYANQHFFITDENKNGK